MKRLACVSWSSILMGVSSQVADVPAVWNAKMKEYLGTEPENDAQGCLQVSLLGYRSCACS